MAVGGLGCASAKQGASKPFWPTFGKRTTDTVPGLTPPADRVAALRAMAKQGQTGDAQSQERISGELEAAFRQEADPWIRQQMIRAVGPYRTASADAVLKSALNDASAEVRVAACLAWGKRGGPEAVTLLGQVLASDVDLDVRQAAVKALGETRDRQAVASLAPALEDRDPAMQYLAVQSLRKTTGEDFGNDVERWRQYVAGNPPPPPSLAERAFGWMWTR